MATVSNFADAQKAVTLATDSQGSAMKENERYMESLQAKVTALKAQFQEMVNGNGGIHDMISALLTLGENILKFVNSDMGQFIIKATATIYILSLMHKGITTLGVAIKGSSFARLIKEIIALKSGIQLATASESAMIISTNGLSGALDVLTASIEANPIGLILTAVVGTTVGMIALAEHIQKTEKNVKSIHKEAVKNKKDVDELETSIKGLTDQLDQIEGKKVNTTDENELRLLEQEERILRNQLEIEEAKLKIKQQQASNDAKSALQETTTFTEIGQDGIGESVEVTRQEGLKKTIEYIEELNKQYTDLQEIMKTQVEAGESESKQYKENEELLAKLNDRILEQKSTATEVASNLLEEASALDTSNEENKKLYDSTMAVVEAWNEYNGIAKETKEETSKQVQTSDELREKYGDLADAVAQYMAEEDISEMEAYTKALENQKGEMEELVETYKSQVSEISNLDDSYSVLSSAVDEYNSSGGLSLDTIGKLLSMGDEYLSLLQFENGQLSINQIGFENLANAKIDEAEATLTQKVQAELLANANANLAQSESNVGYAGASAVSGLDSATQAIIRMANESSTAAGDINKLFTALTGKQSLTLDANSKQQIQSYQNQIKSLESLRSNIGKNVKATGTASRSTGSYTKATNDNTKALEKNVKALEKQKKALEKKKKNYDDVIGYIKDKVNGLIDKLEEQSEKEQEEIQKQIDWKEKEKQANEDYYDNLIQNLEAEENFWKEYYDRQKEELSQSKEDLEEYYEDLIKITRESNGDIMYGLKGLEEYYENQKEILDDLKDSYEEEKKTKLALLEKENDELKDQIELEKLLQNLEQAKTKRKRVYREGQGFVYEQDAEAVSKAQQEIQKYNREKAFETQKQSIEDYYNSLSNNTQKSLDDLTKWYNETKTKVEDEKTTRINAIELELKELEKENKEKEKYFNYEKDRLESEKEIYSKTKDDEIAILESQNEDIKSSYDKRIKYYEDWLKEFEEGITSYDTSKIAKKAREMTGVDFEKAGWEERINNLTKQGGFIDQYSDALKQLEEVEKKYNKAKTKYDDAKSADSGSSGGSGGSSGSGSKSKSTKTTTKDLKSKNQKTTSTAKEYVIYEQLSIKNKKSDAQKIVKSSKKSDPSGKYGVTSSTDGKKWIAYKQLHKGKYNDDAGAKKAVEGYVKSDSTHKKKFGWKLASKLATGTYGVKDDMIAIVGDNPNYQELAVGSRINNGTSMMLKSGTGIVPNNLTSTLVSMAKSYRDGTMKLQSNDVDKSTNISISNISLPQVHNGKEFVDYLQNFSLDMTQVAYSK